MKSSINNTNSNMLARIKVYASFVVLTLIFTCSKVNAIEIGANFHQGEESETKGGSFLIADKFARNSNFYWSLAYNRLDDVRAQWNHKDSFFNIDTVDALISYRYHPQSSYNSSRTRLSFEYQLGFSIALTDNKFDFPNEPLLPDFYLSQSHDINAVLGVNMRYKMSKRTSVNIGLKYQPSFSEFGDISSIFLGINYRFGY